MEPQNPELKHRIRQSYSVADMRSLRTLLSQHDTLTFRALENGLFPAAAEEAASHTGYQAVWVRDNVHVAHSLLVDGDSAGAVRAIRSLAEHFESQSKRFDAIIQDPSLAVMPSNRPHVKFKGYPPGEIPNWAHAQNDALGYFLWMFCRLARLEYLTLGGSHTALLGRFVRYFQAIRYWEDEDSGHWEEMRKNEASSIGVVCAGLRELRSLIHSPRGNDLKDLSTAVPSAVLDTLVDAGLARLAEILPAECIQPPPRRRRYDSALLFLIYPLRIVDDAMADQILSDIRENLQGEAGIRRYPGDSFWCADYRQRLSAGDRTRDFSSDIEDRNRMLQPGTEAQWCIFDPVISVIYGRRYQASGDPGCLQLQIEYFNRSLAQIDRDFRCPELWHSETTAAGTRVPETSEATPLLWTQANLLLALNQMEKSVQYSGTQKTV